MKASSSQTPIHRRALKAGLYPVATPIGNLADITLRALETLSSADLIACEDTRMTGRLLRHYGITTSMEPYHEHNAARKRPELLARIASGAAVALVSDAGTPLISDPGYKLVREAAEAGLRVEAVPGASSVMTALCVAALPTDRFLFLGFLPAKGARAMLEEMKDLRSTLVVFESAKRVAATLELMREVLGDDREAAVARELTKLYEETRRGNLKALSEAYAREPEPRGEIVLVIGPPSAKEADPSQLDAMLAKALESHSLKDAAAMVAEALNLPRGKIYARALELKQ